MNFSGGWRLNPPRFATISYLIPLMIVLLLYVPSTLFATQGYGTSGNAQTLSTPVNLSNDSPTNATFPIVASTGRNVYVSWSEGSGGIKFRASTNHGVNWNPPLSSPAMTLSPSKGLYGIAQFPVMCANGSDVFVAWSQVYSSIGLQIFEATSTNNGGSFSVTRLTSTVGIAQNTTGGYITPAIAASGSNVYVTFAGNGSNSYVMSSNDYGSTWSAPFHYAHYLEDQDAASGNNAYAISDSSLVVSHNGGVSWTAQTTPALTGDEPMIAVAGSNVYVAAESGKSGSSLYEVHVLISNNNGNTFRKIDLTTTVPDSWAPMVGAYGNSSWIAEREYPGSAKGEVWMYSTTNGGQNWTSPISLSGPGKAGTEETFPFEVASTDGEHVFVGWAHQVDSGHWTFMISNSNNGGLTWAPPPGINVSQNKKGEAGFENDLAVAAISSSGIYCYSVYQYRLGDTNQIYLVAFS